MFRLTANVSERWFVAGRFGFYRLMLKGEGQVVLVRAREKEKQ
jgi:hypothetical protein